MDSALGDNDDPATLTGEWKGDWGNSAPHTITKAALESELSYGVSGDRRSSAAAGITQKQGHVICGVCCDSRRAVLIVNSLQFLAAVTMSFLLLVAEELVRFVASKVQRLEDDALQADEQELSQVPVGMLLLLWFSQMILSACGVLGAIRFHAPLVTVSLVSYAVGFVLAANYGHVFILLWNTIGRLCPCRLVARNETTYYDSRKLCQRSPFLLLRLDEFIEEMVFMYATYTTSRARGSPV